MSSAGSPGACPSDLSGLDTKLNALKGFPHYEPGSGGKLECIVATIDLMLEYMLDVAQDLEANAMKQMVTNWQCEWRLLWRNRHPEDIDRLLALARKIFGFQLRVGPDGLQAPFCSIGDGYHALPPATPGKLVGILCLLPAGILPWLKNFEIKFDDECDILEIAYIEEELDDVLPKGYFSDDETDESPRRNSFSAPETSDQTGKPIKLAMRSRSDMDPQE